MTKTEIEAQKERLIQRYLREGILKTPAIVESFRRTPRELFLPEGLRASAYVDTPLPVGWGQTISAPLSLSPRTG
ncbi:MAG: hypothetical protein QW057_08950 [Candidatus Bathyarchaeia archaeon]